MTSSNQKVFSTLLFLLVLTYTFTYFAFDSIAKAALALSSLLIFCYTAKYNKPFFKSLPFFLLAFAFIITLITWALTSIQVPEFAANSIRSEHLLNKFSFIPLALILAESKKRILIFIATAIISALLNPWIAGGGTAEIIRALNGMRTGFGGHIITMGTVYATILIAALVYFHKIREESYSHTKKLLLFFVWATITSAAAIGVYASQSRAIYIGFLGLYLVSFLVIAYLSIKSWSTYKYTFYYFVGFSIAAFCIFYILYQQDGFQWILSKSKNEQSVVWLLLSGNFEQIPKNSSGLRIHFWIEACRWIAERPLTGWGAIANRDMHQQAGHYFGDRPFISIHNDFLEIFFTYGLLGIILFGVLFYWICSRVYNTWQTKQIDTASFVFFGLALLFFMINGFFMSILFFKETVFLWNTILASFTAIVFKNSYPTSSEAIK